MAIAPTATATTSAATDTIVIMFIEFCSEFMLLVNVSNVSLWFCIVLKLSVASS